jgi:hypothetical protein
MHCDEYKNCLAKENGEYVPYDVNEQYGQLFSIIEERQATLFFRQPCFCQYVFMLRRRSQRGGKSTG